ncbi:hypothetical protein GLAREA_02135 [Glarea lozoyensis ATCC 20868]|uniref:Uncharacterized protein n=1 Tax=Glarea lozoyensis (strain ATCC 20868 / MF5171) TaxID=1116229 RepID=S3DI25_GLAL2|nr:uncharacterized protein GLAREA_02135 [Glarea lozoyensis ATCC 20868]EPE26223.1 hypothetical protein GLAREA_02135 [Glarea lozoyensis ATCC 20868]
MEKEQVPGQNDITRKVTPPRPILRRSPYFQSENGRDNTASQHPSNLPASGSLNSSRDTSPYRIYNYPQEIHPSLEMVLPWEKSPSSSMAHESTPERDAKSIEDGDTDMDGGFASNASKPLRHMGNCRYVLRSPGNKSRQDKYDAASSSPVRRIENTPELDDEEMVDHLTNEFHVVALGRKSSGPLPVNPLGDDLTMSPISSSREDMPIVSVTEMEAEDPDLDNSAKIDDLVDIFDTARGRPDRRNTQYIREKQEIADNKRVLTTQDILRISRSNSTTLPEIQVSEEELLNTTYVNTKVAPCICVFGAWKQDERCQWPFHTPAEPVDGLWWDQGAKKMGGMERKRGRERSGSVSPRCVKRRRNTLS